MGVVHCFLSNQGHGDDIAAANEQEIAKIKENLRYFKDDKTGLCFAVLNNQTSGMHATFSITAVPCEKLPATEKGQ